MTDSPNAKIIESILERRAAAAKHNTTPIFYAEDIEALLDELKHASEWRGSDEFVAHLKNHEAYSIALAVLCYKSKRKDRTFRVHPADLERIADVNGTLSWCIVDKGLQFRYDVGHDTVQ